MAQFKIVRRAGGFRAQYWSGGNLVWWTETYVSKQGAQVAIASIKANARTAPVIDATSKAA